VADYVVFTVICQASSCDYRKPDRPFPRAW